MLSEAKMNTVDYDQLDIDEITEFLSLIHPDGPWPLYYFKPYRDKKTSEMRKAPKAHRFMPDQKEELESFLRRHDGVHDLYFLPAIAKDDICSKPKKVDMTATQALWVDIDPLKGKDEAFERIRIYDTLDEKRPRGVPEPTVIVDSGRGFWGYWLLRDICSDVNRAEAINSALSNLLRGDTCHSIEHIARLPGTINLKTGRRSKVMSWHKNNIYSLSDMPCDEMTQAAPKVEVTITHATQLENLDMLDKWRVPDRIKVIIAQGRHPEEGMKELDDSRSAWLFDALCGLVRCKVPDDVICGIITDRIWPISESIYTKADGTSVSSPQQGAVRQIANAKTIVSQETSPKAQNFIITNEGKIVKESQHNILLALNKLGVQLCYDEFANKEIIHGLEDFGPEIDDKAINYLRLRTEREFGFKPSKEYYRDVLSDCAMRNRFHPVRDYLDSLVWDGVPRIDSWLSVYAGAECNPFTQAVGRLMLIAAVRRVRDPGCKFDEMPVLEGVQGTNKSSALALLAGDEDRFSDSVPLDGDDKRVIESTAGRWIIEAAELNGMRKGQIEHLKAMLSRQCDKARMAYARKVSNFPRQFIIVGTTNSDQYLRDSTGNRRFWPVKIEQFDLEKLARDRDQLWAEATAREATGESIRMDKSLWRDAAVEQQKRESEDPFVDVLREKLGDVKGKIRASDTWRLLGIEEGRRTQNDNMRLGDAMRRLGWERKKARLGDKHPAWCYVRGDGLDEIEVRQTPAEDGFRAYYKGKQVELPF